MSNKLAKDDTLQSLVTANQAISTVLGALAKDASMQQLITAVQGLSSGSSGSSGGLTLPNGELNINGGTVNSVSVDNGYINIKTPCDLTVSGSTVSTNGGNVQIAEGNTVNIMQGDLYDLYQNYQVKSGAYTINELFRGKNLGTTITAEQSAAIADGSFTDIFVGDYWEREITYQDAANKEVTDLVRMRVAHCDYRYLNGTLTHHVLVIPEWPLYNAQMNTGNTNVNAYVGSLMYTQNLLPAIEAFKIFFGEDHLLPYTVSLGNAQGGSGATVTTGWIEVENRLVDLLNCNMVFGTTYDKTAQYGNMDKTLLSFRGESDKEQLAIFKHRPDLRIVQTSSTNTALFHWWLRDAYSSPGFVVVNSSGAANGSCASNSYGVRPASLIY